MRAKVYLAQRDLAHAEPDLLKAIEIDPKLEAAYLLYAQLYMASDRPDEAIQKLNAFVEQNKSVPALMQLAFIYDKMKNFSAAREAYESLLALAARYPNAHSFHAFCIFITWQQVTEETIAQHFQTGLRLCETFLASTNGKHQADVEQITELYGSFRDGLGLDEEDEIHVEFRRDTPKGGD